MGVDFYTCQNESCGRNYPDCGDYFTCSNCESRFCSDECGGKQYIEDEEGNRQESDWGDATTCILCRMESVPMSDMVQFLLNKLNLTYEQAAEMYRKENKD